MVLYTHPYDFSTEKGDNVPSYNTLWRLDCLQALTLGTFVVAQTV